MITIDRMSLPIHYRPQVGDMLVITEITGGDRGRWKFKVARIEPVIPKEMIAWLLKRLDANDAAAFMLWCSTGKPLPSETREEK